MEKDKISKESKSTETAQDKGVTSTDLLYSSFIKNCLLKPRSHNEILFEYEENKDLIHSRLDGYAIVPVEDYIKLENQSPTGTKNT